MIDREKVENLLKITKNLKLLYVEDNEDARNQMLKMLKNFFTDIDTAVDGYDGYEKYKSKQYDLVITDINMPNMNGLKMSEKILQINYDMHIIVLSAYNDTEYLQNCIDLGITNYIHKPVTLEGLVNVLTKSVKSLIQQNKLKNLNIQINNLLNNAKEGYLSFKEDFICNGGYSKKCLEIFDIDDIEGLDISKLLFQNTPKSKELFQTGIKNISQCGDDFQKELFLSLLPNVQIINDKIISLEYKILNDQNFMLILTDITNQKKLEKEIEKQHKIQNMLVAVAVNRTDFLELKGDFFDFLASPPKDIEELLRNLHTFKGNFAQKEMIYIVDAIHQAETKIKEDMELKDKTVLENLYQTFQKDLDIIRNTFEADFCNDKKTLKINPKSLQIIEKKLKKLAIQQNDIKDSIEEILFHINRLRYKPLSEKLSIYKKQIALISKKYEKPIHPLTIDGDNKVIVPNRLKQFIKSLVHIFNNSLMHGIEDMDTRAELGKDPIGTIKCNYEQIQNTLILEISDDGAGIDVDKVVKKAVKKGLKTQTECDKLSFEEKLKLIFLQDLSTSDTVNITSGRGVGMSAVYDELKKLNGEVYIESKKDKGTRFKFLIPIEKKYFANINHEELIFESLYNQTVTLLEENSKINLLEKKLLQSFEPLLGLSHIKIDFIDGFFGNCIFSFPQNILDELQKSFFIGSFTQEEITQMKKELANEIVNTIVGLSIADISKNRKMVSISVPKILNDEEIKTLIKKADECYIYEIKTTKGSIFCTIANITTEKDTVFCNITPKIELEGV